MFIERRFTLIELMAVIAIVAILASLLFPALNSARSKVRQIACVSNLRQVNLAMMNYKTDNKDYYIPYDNTAGTYSWPLNLRNLYQVNYKVYSCPETVNYTKCASFIASGLNDNNKYRYIDFGYNYLHLGSSIHYDANNKAPARDSDLQQPSRTLMMADVANSNQQESFYLLMDWIGTYGMLNDRHKNSASFLWCDGHVSLEKNSYAKYMMHWEKLDEILRRRK